MGSPGAVGADLVELMDAQAHRGADSTGFAVYGPPLEKGYVLRGMGFDKNALDSDLDDFRALLKSHGSDFINEPSIVSDQADHYCVRMLITDPNDIRRLGHRGRQTRCARYAWHTRFGPCTFGHRKFSITQC